MDPITGGIIAGGIGGLFNFLGTSSTNSANQQLMQQQEAYQTQMSNTAYQRASADMKAAGLNPMMMFGSGGPASTPSAPSSAPRESPMKAVSGAITQGMQTAVQAKTMDKMATEMANLQSENALIRARTNLTDTEQSRTAQQYKTEVAETAKRGAEAETAGVDAHKARLFDAIMTDPMGRKIVQGGMVGNSASSALKPVLDVAGELTGTALRKKGLDLMRERLGQDKYSHSSTTSGKDDFGNNWSETTMQRGQ